MSRDFAIVEKTSESPTFAVLVRHYTAEEAEAFAYYLKADHIEYARRMAALRTAAIGRVAARMAGLVMTYRRKCEAQEDGA